MIKKFISAIQFLTIIPINRKYLPTEKELAKSTIYFPFVGLIIGAFLVLTNEFFSLFFSKIFVSCLILIIGVIITCGFHLDGLIDTFDGLFSGFKNKDRIIEIMKDPRVGAMGVIFLFLFLLLKFSLIYELKNDTILKALILMPAFGRWATVFGARFYTPAKRTNLSLVEVYTSYVGNFEFVIATIFIVFFSILIFGINSVIIIGIVLIFNVLFFNYIKSKIGGITGDTLGAGCEMTEVLFLLVVILL